MLLSYAVLLHNSSMTQMFLKIMSLYGVTLSFDQAPLKTSKC